MPLKFTGGLGGALGWRLVLGALRAQVRVSTLTEAAEVATLAAAACPDAPGQLSLDLSGSLQVPALVSVNIAVIGWVILGYIGSWLPLLLRLLPRF